MTLPVAFPVRLDAPLSGIDPRWKLAALLTQPGHTYDVSSPDLPTVK